MSNREVGPRAEFDRSHCFNVNTRFETIGQGRAGPSKRACQSKAKTYPSRKGVSGGWCGVGGGERVKGAVVNAACGGELTEQKLCTVMTHCSCQARTKPRATKQIHKTRKGAKVPFMEPGRHSRRAARGVGRMRTPRVTRGVSKTSVTAKQDGLPRVNPSHLIGTTNTRTHTPRTLRTPFAPFRFLVSSPSPSAPGEHERGVRVSS